MELRDLIKAAKDLTKNEPIGIEEARTILYEAQMYGVQFSVGVPFFPNPMQYTLSCYDFGNTLFHHVVGGVRSVTPNGKFIVFETHDKAFQALKIALLSLRSTKSGTQPNQET